MNLKRFWLVLFILFSFLPIIKIFAQTPNTGFVSGNIWYSQDPFEEGDKIKIYTFLFNPDKRELSGTVIFFDKTVLLGKKDFIIPGKTAKDLYIDWTVNVGDHIIFGKIENAKFLISPGKYEEVYLAENETEKSSRNVSKKILPKLTDSIIDNLASSPVSNITKKIEDSTPEYITLPIVSAVEKLEEFRKNTSISSESKKEEVKKEINNINIEKTKSDSKTQSNLFLKPFKYVELFSLNLFTFILNNKFVFYGIIIILIYLLLRFIWNIFF